MIQRVAVLEWRAWRNFLLPRVLGAAAVRREVDPFSEFPEDRFEELCRSASVVCFHINLSVRRGLPLRVAQLARRFHERGVHVVNGQVEDIRKSALHGHLEAIGLPSLRAPQSGPADELLFLKTDLNYGGETERMIPPALRDALALGELISPSLEAGSYRLVRRAELDPAVWEDPSLVVERYVSNPEGSFHRVYFAGKQVIIVRAYDPSVIKKLGGDARDMNYVSEFDYLLDGSDGLPISARLKRDVATFLARTPVEFGCLDVVHDGRDNHSIIDLNPTPSAPDGSPDEALNAFLRRGITSPSQRRPFLGSSAAAAAGRRTIAP